MRPRRGFVDGICGNIDPAKLAAILSGTLP
jgi:hypothetical protein